MVQYLLEMQKVQKSLAIDFDRKRFSLAVSNRIALQAMGFD